MSALAARVNKAIEHCRQVMDSGVDIDALLSTPLSNDDVQQLVGNKVGIMTYGQAFDKTTDIKKELARYPERAIIFLYQSRQGYGHWLSVFEQGPDVLSVFDPYGGYPDSWGRYVDESTKKKLGEDAPYLLAAIMRAHYLTVFWNEYPFQYQSPKIQTCGRWAAVRILNRDLSVEQFVEFIYSIARGLEISTDEVICLVTSH